MHKIILLILVSLFFNFSLNAEVINKIEILEIKELVMKQ